MGAGWVNRPTGEELIERISVVLSSRRDNRGNSSVTRTPGRQVLIAWNGLRTRSGTLSLGSHRSRWLGPPWRYGMMTLRARPKPGPWLAAAGAGLSARAWRP